MTTLDDLEARVFGHRAGDWYWLANSLSVNQETGLRWDLKQGTHPFVLVTDYTGGPSARSRARSAHYRSDFAHPPHPSDCSPTCKIKMKGWIQKVRWPLKASALDARWFSCHEPDEDVVARLRHEGSR
jgi:hypothetical protein